MEKNQDNINFTACNFYFKDSVLGTPIFRAANGRGPWTYAAATRALLSLGHRFGFQDSLTAYCFRRGALGVLDSRL